MRSVGVNKFIISDPEINIITLIITTHISRFDRVRENKG